MGHVQRRQVVEGQHLDAGRVNDAAAETEGEHLGESGRVLAFAGVVGDIARAQVEVGFYSIDKRGFADARLPGYQRCFAPQKILQSVQPIARFSGDEQHFVTDAFVKVFQDLEGFQCVVVVEVGLVEGDAGGDVVWLGHEQEAVNKPLLQVRLDDGGDEQRLVHVGGDEVHVPLAAGRLPDDAVAAGQHFLDDAPTLLVRPDNNFVAHSDGVGGFQIF